MQAISEWAKSKTLQEQRRFLPVYDCREELLQVIRENQVVVVVGETGSGKTTQVRKPWLQVLYSSVKGVTRTGLEFCQHLSSVQVSSCLSCNSS